MGMQSQRQQAEQQGQVYYDTDTGQYYTQTAPRNNRPFANMFGIQNQEPIRNYLNNINNQSMTARPEQQYTPIDIASLFPELYQSVQGMQGDSQMSTGLLGGQGAAQSASSGAGRFM
jgi:hypothetical protein